VKVVLCVPTLRKPHQATLDAIAASVPLLDAAGWDHAMVSEVGCPYVSAARATMLRKALDAKADAIVFIDHDVSWWPADLLKLVITEGDYVAGTYRFKREPEEYMGQLLPGEDGRPIVRADGALKAFCAPAGFLKITPRAVNRTIEVFPELCYGERHSPHVDFFNHGAHNFVWFGEDYAACRRWREMDEDVWIVPDLALTHHAEDGTAYPGNFHEFMLRQPGGSNDPERTR
jgi:hypothetical protein